MGTEEINIPREIETDGFITRPSDLKPLKKVSDNTATPTSECCYPLCEKCKDYVGFNGARYCTVPIVVNKQLWTMTTNAIKELKRRMDGLECDFYSSLLKKPEKKDDERELYDKTIIDLAGEQQ